MRMQLHRQHRFARALSAAAKRGQILAPADLAATVARVSFHVEALRDLGAADGENEQENHGSEMSKVCECARGAIPDART
jgi:hypothetical protein